MSKWKDKLRAKTQGGISSAKATAASLKQRAAEPIDRVRQTQQMAKEAGDVILALEGKGVMRWDSESNREKISTDITKRLNDYIPLDKEFTEEQIAEGIHRAVVEAFPDLGDLLSDAERIVAIQVTKARTGKRLTWRGWRK